MSRVPSLSYHPPVSEEPPVGFSDLTDECVVSILWRLRVIKDWLTCTHVCKRWARLADDGLSVVRLTHVVAYQGRGGAFSLIQRFPNLYSLVIPTSACTNAFFGALGFACSKLQILFLTTIPAALKQQGHKSEPQSLPQALGCLTSLTELRILSDQVAGLPRSMGCLTNLRLLELESCKRVKNVPASLAGSCEH